MKILSPIMLYSATVVGVVATGTLFMMKERYWRMMETTSSFGDKLLEVANILFFLPVILVPFTHWYECGKKVTFANNWKRMQVRTLDEIRRVKITGEHFIVTPLCGKSIGNVALRQPMN